MNKLLLGAGAALVAIGLLPMSAAWDDRDSDETSFVTQINDVAFKVTAKELSG
jgi:hypothetical protein